MRAVTARHLSFSDQMLGSYPVGFAGLEWVTLYSFPVRQDFAQYFFTPPRGDWVAARQPLGLVAFLNSMLLSWNMEFLNVSPAQPPNNHFPEIHEFCSIRRLSGHRAPPWNRTDTPTGLPAIQPLQHAL